ncbi:hypothetical protein ABID46_000026 [Moheibacter stercoris]|uniref:Uncharacterized protein n=1 Tax=Moheibacter stercoris TaxID=1628251 RepID=A0ABV2LPJ2_9FLAO
MTCVFCGNLSSPFPNLFRIKISFSFVPFKFLVCTLTFMGSPYFITSYASLPLGLRKRTLVMSFLLSM